ncbi:hypothetical protein QNH39_26690 [Neobacillus novalis]|uniref:Uncharacterized protein n=1 Tax=Neobacillus novalis TaxID=220687 RepID=A0AA95MLE4_9BACI|nr:hypothetical protein [Neobacillus novalis]WHY86119.1 hypothetical protein QNH39_26690 [Neobacillus novalis]
MAQLFHWYWRFYQMAQLFHWQWDFLNFMGSGESVNAIFFHGQERIGHSSFFEFHGNGEAIMRISSLNVKGNVFCRFLRMSGVNSDGASFPEFKLLLLYDRFQLADAFLQTVDIMIGFSDHLN